MKIGEWIVFEYKIVQIVDMKGDDVTEVTDGSFRTSGRSLSDRCYPLTIANKNAADYVAHYANKVHNDTYQRNINYPDLHRKATELAHEIMSIPEGDEDARKKAYDEASTFYRELFNALDELNGTVVGGVRLFGR
jgi:predicted HAD superfamily phosphohydrolase